MCERRDERDEECSGDDVGDGGASCGGVAGGRQVRALQEAVRILWWQQQKVSCILPEMPSH